MVLVCFFLLFIVLVSSSSSASMFHPTCSVGSGTSFFLLLPFFLVFGSSSGLFPSLFSASGLVSVYLILGGPTLPLGSSAVSGCSLFVLSLFNPWPPAKVNTSAGRWVLDDADALFLICASVISSSSSDIGTGCNGVNTLDGLMWCICGVIVGLFCLKNHPLWFIVVSSLLLLAASPLCCSSAVLLVFVMLVECWMLR